MSSQSDRLVATSDEFFDGALEVGASRIGDYRVLGHWASGVVSHVYVARREPDSDSSKLYALKVPRTAHAIYAAGHGVFLRGAEQGPTTEHPHTVSTREVLDRNGRLYMVTDFVNGEVLARMQRALPGEAWPAPMALMIGLHLARGLSFVHQNQTPDAFRPHGEVSPRNVLVGYDGLVRLIDSAIIGTERRLEEVRHMAPEQAAQMPDLDARCDVYGVGLVVWELLTGRPALVGRDETEIRAAALEGRIDAPSAAGARCDASVDEVVMRALAIERGHRYGSALELEQALADEITRLAPDRDLEADLREVLQRTFPRGASRLPRALQRWSQPPDYGALNRPDGPMAAIRASVEARRGPPDPTFDGIDAAIADLSQALPPVTSDLLPSPAASAVDLRRSSQVAPPPRNRRGLLIAAVVAGLAVVGLLGAFLARDSAAPAPKAALRIVTEPAGATVVLGGAERGLTPVTLDGLEVGVTHRVEIRKEGFGPVDREVRFGTAGQRGWHLELPALGGAEPDPTPDPESGSDPESFKDNPY